LKFNSLYPREINPHTKHQLDLALGVYLGKFNKIETQTNRAKVRNFKQKISN
jgi:hypothetical protein